MLERRPYSQRPPRHEYHLTGKDHGLLPVLVALQDWGTRHVMGDGSLTETSTASSLETKRVHELVGQRIEVDALTAQDGSDLDPIGETRWTVLYCFPGCGRAWQPVLPSWVGRHPGAAGCTLESLTYRDRHPDFAAACVTGRGISTQRPDQLAAFAEHARLPFALLSDTDLILAASLRLPTFRAAGVDRFKRLTLVVDGERSIRGVLFPVTDPAASVDEALAVIR